jgi:hypothetical protein
MLDHAAKHIAREPHHPDPAGSRFRGIVLKHPRRGCRQRCYRSSPGVMMGPRDVRIDRCCVCEGASMCEQAGPLRRVRWHDLR